MTQPTTTTSNASTPAADAPAAFDPALIAEVFGPDEGGEASTNAPPEPSKPAAETTSKEKTAAERIAVAFRAEQKTDRARADLEARQRKLDEQKHAQDQREAELRLIEEEPAKYFELKKRGPEAIQEHLEKLAGTYKPEAVQERQLSAQDRRIKELEDKIAADKAAVETKARTEAQRGVEAEAGKNFIAHVTSAVDKYPNLTQEFTEEQAITTAYAVLESVVAHVRGPDGKPRPVTLLQAYTSKYGMTPSDDVVADHLDRIAKERIEARAKTSWGKVGAAPARASQAVPGDSKVPPVNGTSPRTLSSRDTSQRSAAPRTRGNQWTAEDQAEADEVSMRILAGASTGT